MSRSAFLSSYYFATARLTCYSQGERSRHLTATFVLLLGLLVEVDGHGTQVLAAGHQRVEVLPSLEDVVQVLMHDLLDFEQFLLDFHQLVRLVWVLPFLQEVLDIRVR